MPGTAGGVSSSQPRDPATGQNIPIPDPSVLTTQNLDREIANLREYLLSQIVNLADDLERFASGHDREHRDVVERAVSHVRELNDERFKGIQLQFAERDVRAEQAFKASTEAINAAMAAQEKAIIKSEIATAKQIDAIAEVIESATKALQEQIRNVEKRQDRDEGGKVGAREVTVERTEHDIGMSRVGSLALAAAVAFFGLCGLVVAVIVAVTQSRG
jgi:hypothetical protein